MKFDSRQMLTIGTIVLLIGTIVAFLAPYILTRGLLGVSFAETGQIGDTIGGLTAPFINLLSAILVYLALYAQVEANKLIQDQIADQKLNEIKQKNFANILEMYNQVKTDFDNFSFTSRFMDGNTKTYSKGSESIEFFFPNFIRLECPRIASVYEEPNFTEAKRCFFFHLIKNLNSLLKKINNTSLSKIDKETLTNLAVFIFQTRLEIFLPNKCHNCETSHSLMPDNYLVTIAEIKRSIEETQNTGLSNN
jgi:hypothetical protein